MAWKKEDIEKEFSEIVEEISKGSSLRAALNINGRPSSATFYDWLDKDDEKLKRYARATQDREEKIFDEILEIADKQGQDVLYTDIGEVVNHNVIQRNKLQIEARQWVLGKMRPDKYGTKHIEQKNTGDIKIVIDNLDSKLGE